MNTDLILFLTFLCIGVLVLTAILTIMMIDWLRKVTKSNKKPVKEYVEDVEL